MAHLRTQIRDRIVTVLTGLATTGAGVYKSRVFAVSSDNLPCILVYTGDEVSEPVNMSGDRRYERTVTVKVEALTMGVDGHDDQLDQIGLEVEAAINADVELNGLAEDSRFISFETDFSDQGELPLARATISIEVDYEHLESDPETTA